MKTVLRGLTVLAFSSLAFADHVPGVGLNYSGTWVVLIAVGVIFSLLILSLLWAFLDGQFQNAEQVKYAVANISEDDFIPLIERPLESRR
jgi:nitrogen fixation-related uncharacterized protein